MYMQSPKRPEEGVGFFGTGVTTMWVLGTELRISLRALSALHPPPKHFLSIVMT